MIENPKINLLDAQDINEESEAQSQTQRKKVFFIKAGKFSFYLGLVLMIAFFILSSKIVFPSDDSVFASIKRFSQNYLLSPIQFFSSGAKKLEGEQNDRVNFLLMGIGGYGHPGAFLTDTIILASYKPSTEQLALTSIPRDMVVPIKGYGWRKINNLNAFGEIENPGHGTEYAAEFISELFDLPIQYHFRVDFSGFEELVDILGGVNIFVENTLDDYQYPIKGRESEPLESRYEHLHVDKGYQHMDGQLALKYARSRHAAGVENSDFARAKRQQNILKGVKDKVLSYKTLLNPVKLLKIINNLEEHIKTNVGLTEIARLIEIAKSFDDENIINKVLDNGPDGPLVNNMYDGSYVLETRDNDFGEIKLIINNIFNQDYEYVINPNTKKTLLGEYTEVEKEIQNTSTNTDTNNTNVNTNTNTNENNEAIDTSNNIVSNTPIISEKEIVSIEILNGTWITGLASVNKTKLENWGYDSITTGNAKTHDYETTIIYDLSNGQYKKTFSFLQEKFTTNVKTISNSELSQADFLIILGQDTKN